jgi:hypothetical protein
MIELRLSFPDADAAIAALSKLGSAAHNADVERSAAPTIDVQVEKPKRTRKAAVTTEATTGPVMLGAAAPDAAHAPIVNAAVDLFAASAPKEDAPTPPKQPEQKDLIAALRAAYDKSADKAIAIVTHFGVKAVGQIPKDKWAEAIAMAQKAVAA